MSWFEKLLTSRIRTEGGNKRNVPEGLWTKCPSCNAVLYRAELERNADVCPKCSHHIRQKARRRLEQFLDAEPRVEIGESLSPVDPLKFRDSKKYKERLTLAQKSTGESDAYLAFMGQVKGVPEREEPLEEAELRDPADGREVDRQAALGLAVPPPALARGPVVAPGPLP